MALIDKLSAIGDAIREKTGKSELLTLDAMPAAIGGIETGGGGGSIEVDPVVLTGDCTGACKGALASAYIKIFGDTVSTKDITAAQQMFQQYKNETIPFSVNFKPNTGNLLNVSSMFGGATALKELPEVNNLSPGKCESMFDSCWNLREIPEGFGDNWDWSLVNKTTSSVYSNLANLFNYCHSLRKIPESFLSHCYHCYKNYSIYNSGFSNCWALDEIRGLPVHPGVLASNVFSSTFTACHRLKEMTFAMNEDGTPKTAPWTGAQTIDLSYAGYATNNITDKLTQYNSGITSDKQVVTDARYQALKNDPDWYTQGPEFSRYNHDSAVNTINSLPDATATGVTHTIKFKGEAGSSTDGGAINTLTEEEIAVATAKGWTVTLV